MTKFGNTIGAKQLSFMFDNSKELHTRWHPQIEVNGRLLFISDFTAPTGTVEFDNKDAALQYARELLEGKGGEVLKEVVVCE